MRPPVRHSLAVAASLLALAACGRDRGANGGGADSTALEADSALARDLAMASESRPATTTFGDTAMSTTSDRVAAAPTPRRTTATNTAPPRPAPARQAPTRPPARTPSPAPVPQPPRTVASNPLPSAPAPAASPAPAPSGRGFAAGTGFGVATGQKVCTNNLPGDKLVATIDHDVAGRGGAVIPAGSKLVLEVASVDRGDNGSPRITFRVRAVDIAGHSYPAAATGDATGPFERTRVASSGSSDAKKVLGGAAAGAILGQILGKDTKGTIIGAAAGAAAGAVVAKRGEHYESCLPSGSAVHLVLQDEVLM